MMHKMRTRRTELCLSAGTWLESACLFTFQESSYLYVYRMLYTRRVLCIDVCVYSNHARLCGSEYGHIHQAVLCARKACELTSAESQARPTFVNFGAVNDALGRGHHAASELWGRE